MNCILSNPYDRNKVVKTGLFNNRMTKIDENIRLELFVGVFLKTFPISNVCLYGHPVVIRCEITIYEDDKMMKHAVEDFKKIFMINDGQLNIKYSAIKSNRNFDTLSPWTLNDMVYEVMYKYEQMFPCSFILNMFNDDNPSLDGTKVIVVPLVRAKEVTINTLREIIRSIHQSITSTIINEIMNEYINCIVGKLDEQCLSEYLPKEIKFKISEQMTNCPIIDREIEMSLFDSDDDSLCFKEAYGGVIDSYGMSTFSGVIRSNDDFFIFTTGHGLNDGCTVDSGHYMLKDFMWPTKFREGQIQNDNYFKSNIAKDAKIDTATVSDVCLLQPQKGVKDKFLAKKQCFIKQDFIKEYNKEGNPVLPNKEQIEGTVQYIGCKSEGEMKIIGTACIGRDFMYKISEGKKQRLLFYERLYVAEPISDKKGECSVPGDSGACVTKKVTIGDTEVVKIHSFLKGTLKGKEISYKLLSPAHFVLEQVKKLLGDDVSPSFVSYKADTMTSDSNEDTMNDDLINHKVGSFDEDDKATTYYNDQVDMISRDEDNLIDNETD